MFHSCGNVISVNQTFLNSKGGVYLEAGYGILAPIFRFFVCMTWKIDIAEGFDAPDLNPNINHVRIH